MKKHFTVHKKVVPNKEIYQSDNIVIVYMIIMNIYIILKAAASAVCRFLQQTTLFQGPLLYEIKLISPSLDIHHVFNNAKEVYVDARVLVLSTKNLSSYRRKMWYFTSILKTNI